MMRVLTRCYACQRQYDVSHREPGSQFRCRCSKVLTVPDATARQHDAAVVKCSNCGGPRQGDAHHCGFCGASFNLHERDLHVLCPDCFTRVSRHASFCHSCGIPISVDQELGGASELGCPVCEGGPALVHRVLGAAQTPVLECTQCAGLWVSHSLFERAVRAHEREAFTAGVVNTESSVAQAVKQRRQEGPMYRKCPECDTVMHRRNYARRSGIIIDVCPQHGIWFDSRELDAILSWLRNGGEGGRSTQGSRYVPDHPALGVMDAEAHRASIDADDGRAPHRSGGFSYSARTDRIADGFDVAGAVTELLSQLFR